MNELERYITFRMLEKEEAIEESKKFAKKLEKIAKKRQGDFKSVMAESIFFLCQAYGCENILETPFKLEKNK